MQERHRDSERYFKEQALTTEKFVIPYVADFIGFNNKTRVLEIGCSMGGNLLPFLDRGCQVTGIDISDTGIELAKKLLAGHPNVANLNLICDDIYNRSAADGQFDFVFMRDVIEHIHDQKRFMAFARQFLAPGAIFFFAFPPWYNPFGGHQQICHNRLLSKLPYYHILPAFLYKSILKLGGESQKAIDDLLEIKQTGISIERFERIAVSEGYSVKRKTMYFINPNYETKFGLKPRVLAKLISGIPFLRNFFTTAGYYVLTCDTPAQGKQ